MNILQLTDEYNAAGGMERFIYNLSGKLAEQRHRTAVAAFGVAGAEAWGDSPIQTIEPGEEAEAWRQAAEQFGAELIMWHAGPRTARIAEHLARYFPVVATVHGVLCPSGMRLFRDNDAICTKQSGIGCMVNWYARRCGTDASPKAAWNGYAVHKQMMRALGRCARVYAVSRAVQSFLVLEGVAAEKVRVFDNTLQQQEPVLQPLQLPLAGSPLKLLYVGRLVYSKGVQYLLRAVHELRKRGIPVECSIVGDGWYEPELRSLAASLKLEQTVYFAGKVSGKGIGEWYAASDIVIVPSIWPDPAPLVVPEARTCGKPVVVFEAGGLPEWAEVLDGVFVTEHRTPEALADTIVSVRKQSAVPDAERKRPFRQQRVNLIRDVTAVL